MRSKSKKQRDVVRRELEEARVFMTSAQTWAKSEDEITAKYGKERAELYCAQVIMLERILSKFDKI